MLDNSRDVSRTLATINPNTSPPAQIFTSPRLVSSASRLANMTPLPAARMPPSATRTALKALPPVTAPTMAPKDSTFVTLRPSRSPANSSDPPTELDRLQQQVATLQARLLTLEAQDNARRTRSRGSDSGSPCSASPSPTHRRPPPSLGGLSGEDLAALLQFQFAALAEQRREDQREREEARRADRELLAAQIAAVMASHAAAPGRSNYVVGRALSSFPTFAGTSKEDCDSYLREFEGKAGPQGHCIPADYWPNELFLKLEGPAKDWYNTTFTTKGLLPTWAQLSSGLQRLFGHRYTASPTWLKLGAATRLANESGPEALQRVQTLLSDLALLRVPINPGPTEAMCYILQGQLTPEELRRWMAQANADKDVSDDGIHAKEDALAARLATPNRLSVATTDSGAERDSWFAPRLAHLETFLRDQAATGRAQPARAAATAGLSPADPPVRPSPSPTPPTVAATFQTAASPAPGQSSGGAPTSDNEARCMANRADRVDKAAGRGLKNNTPAAPPEYFGPRDSDKNQAEFERRRAAGACFHCPMEGPFKVDYTLWHTLCPTHGKDSRVADRHDPAKRVKGAGKVF